MSKEKKASTSDVVEASKSLITQTRAWSTTMREAMWAPFLGMSKGNDAFNMMVNPWMDMTRAAQDQWWDMFENQTSEMLDKSSEMFKRYQP